MFKKSPAISMLCALIIGSACCGLVSASPATELFQAASEGLLDHYYGWSELDRPALVARYAQTLGEQCAPSGDSCTFEAGRAVIKQMLAELHDAHTNIRDAEGAERLREVQQDLTVPRTGLRVVKTPLGLLVVGVMPGSPAEVAGVQRFDLLTAVNGVGQQDGKADSAAFVRLERQGAPISAELVHAGQSLTLTLATAPMKARDVPILSWRLGRSGPVAVIQYPTFLSADSAELFLKALGEAQVKGARGLVIDLRYNGGGRLDQCVQAASAFLPTLYQARSAVPVRSAQTLPARTSGAGQGPLPAPVVNSWDYAALRGQLGSPDRVRAALADTTGGPQGLWQGPAALIIDENTASCAEVFGFFAHKAGALLVGQPTKGVMNSGVNFFPLPDQGVMSVTMLRAYDPEGQPLPDHLRPDLNIPADLQALVYQGQDAALQAALQAVESRQAGVTEPPAGTP